ncbi:Parkin co-regulated protein [Spironucleus salmonicida]|uniref:Parkin co-regulated protein n=1 Tax=Spironucleus salmonicida TaxID=348837 RepID=V6LLL8_9EUKA|nr:Parkin co-regulated protein [Spironucleus salmonicida]|eukprot:EST41599.1 Parkin co-regulated protein [Spironucleus salmonicida]
MRAMNPAPPEKAPKNPNSPFCLRQMPPTEFRMYYNRGDIPCSIVHSAVSQTLNWRTDKSSLDLHHYLPLFFEGLRETQHPFSFIAEVGVRDLLEEAGQRVVPVIPQLILPIKKALETRDEGIICKTLRSVVLLLNADQLVGPALVPYFRQILPVLNVFYSKNVNIGDKVYYGQKKVLNIGDLIHDVLEMMEMKGGPDALINIRYMVPCYQSCMQ